MKNKKTTYILLVAVVALWGTIVYKFFSGGDEEFEVEYVKPKKQVHIPSSTMPDTFDVVANYRDPFFGKVYKKKQNTHVVKKPLKQVKKKEEKKEPEIVVHWPRLDYRGLINSETKSVGLILYEGKERIIMPGDSLEGIYVKALTADSVALSFMGEERMVY